MRRGWSADELFGRSVWELDDGRKCTQVRLKFQRGRVSGTAVSVHVFVAAYAEWFSGIPQSFRIRYATACGGRQTYTPVSASDKAQITCRRCRHRIDRGLV